MKEKIKLICFILIFVLSNNTFIYAHPNTTYLSVTDDSILLQSQDAPGKAVSKNFDSYSLLPKDVINFLKQHNYHIYLLSEEEGLPDSSKYLGMTYFIVKDNNYKLYTDIYCCSREPDDTSTLLHEVGHALDYTYSSTIPDTKHYYMISHDKVWLYYYNKYKKTIAELSSTSQYNLYNESEAWAECFCYYILKPDILKNDMPEIYNYIDHTVLSLSKYKNKRRRK